MPAHACTWCAYAFGTELARGAQVGVAVVVAAGPAIRAQAKDRRLSCIGWPLRMFDQVGIETYRYLRIGLVLAVVALTGANQELRGRSARVSRLSSRTAVPSK